MRAPRRTRHILQAAKLLGVSRLTLYRWIARNEIGRENPTRNFSEPGALVQAGDEEEGGGGHQ